MHNKKTILVVDDNEDIREMMQLALEPEGYRVLTAATEAETIAACLEHEPPPDLIILDYLLDDQVPWCLSGVTTGDEIIKHLVALGVRSHFKILLFAASERSSSKWREYGADGLLEKPFRHDISEWYTAIAEILGDGRHTEPRLPALTGGG